MARAAVSPVSAARYGKVRCPEGEPAAYGETRELGTALAAVAAGA